MAILDEDFAVSRRIERAVERTRTMTAKAIRQIRRLPLTQNATKPNGCLVAFRWNWKLQSPSIVGSAGGMPRFNAGKDSFYRVILRDILALRVLALPLYLGTK